MSAVCVHGDAHGRTRSFLDHCQGEIIAVTVAGLSCERMIYELLSGGALDSIPLRDESKMGLFIYL